MHTSYRCNATILICCRRSIDFDASYAGLWPARRVSLASVPWAGRPKLEHEQLPFVANNCKNIQAYQVTAEHCTVHVCAVSL